MIGVFFASGMHSQAGFHPKGHKPPPKPVYMAIASVDTTAMTITVEPKNNNSTATKTYKITPKTKVTINGNPGTLSDLRPGLQIHVGLGMDADVAEELSASPAPADPK